MQKILIIEYYKNPDDDRHKEIIGTINDNIKSGLFEEIVIFYERSKPRDLKKNNTVTYVKAPRTTFTDRFRYANEHFEDGDICIVANSDILFDETIKEVEKIGNNNFFALTRHEADGEHKGVIGSQDVWVVKTPIREEFVENVNFELGRTACDHVVVSVAVANGYYVENPSLLIKTYHKHKDYEDLSNRMGIYHNAVEGEYIGVASTDYFIPCDLGDIPRRPRRQERRMVLTFSPSHNNYVDKYFKTIENHIDDIKYTVFRQEQESPSGVFRSKGWEQTTYTKLMNIRAYVYSLNFGDIFIYSDVDVQFFDDPFEEIEEYLRFTDFAFQNDVNTMVNDSLPICTGFMMMRVTKESRLLLDTVISVFKDLEKITCDQMAFQYVLGTMGNEPKTIRYLHLLPRDKYLTIASDDDYRLISKRLVMHHGNYRVGFGAKSAIMDEVRTIYENLT